MKTKIKTASYATIMTLVLCAAATTQASTHKDGGRGSRLTTSSNATVEGKRLTTMSDFENLKHGDKVAAWCPMMKRTYVTTIHNPDGRARVDFTKTKHGMKMDGCNIVLHRKAGSREVQSMMVCPDGTLTPIHCSKI